jgi:hypothetical protein
MSTASPEGPPGTEPVPARKPGAPAGGFRSLWYRYARKAALPALFVLAIGLGLLLARAATYRKAHAAGFERGRAFALRELELRMTQNDSIRHEGELQAIRMLRNVRFFYLGRHSKGWCFLKYADVSGPNWSTGWVADMRFMEQNKEYTLDRDGTVWNRRLY